MPYRKPLQWPEKSLSIKSVDVIKEDDYLPSLLEDMVDTIKVERGGGLAAPQIGLNQKVILIDVASWEESSSFLQKLSSELVEDRYWFLLNPSLSLSDQAQKWSEGCLSVPWVTAEVERASACSVSYLTTDFEPREINLPWPLSGAVQHEYDHLEGKLYLNRISRLKSARLKNFITKKRKKIEDYREDLLKDSEEKKIGRNKRREREKLSRKETKKRKAVKKLNSRSRRA